MPSPAPARHFLTAAVAFAVAACGSTTEPVRPAAVIVAPAADTLTPGAERQLAARVVNLAGDTVVAEGTLWSSSAPDVAWVAPDGKVTAVGFGSATITALVSDERGAAAIRVQRTFSARTVAVGPHTVCAIDLSGQAWCFGDNDNGQLGVGNVGIPRATLTGPVIGGHTFTSIGVGQQAVCGLDQAGKVWCWGSPDFLGQGRVTNSFQPVSVPVLADTVRTYDALTVGGVACGIAADAVYCWGYFSGVSKIYNTPVPGFTSITMGYDRGCGITAAGAATCWIEDGSSISFYGWSSEFPGPAPVAQVVIGDGFRCARYADRHAICLGTNDAGQLGNGTTLDASTPTSVPGSWQQLAAGEKSACGLATDGSAWCWGANESGQLGTGDSTASLVPVAVASPEKFRDISMGGLSFYGGALHRTCAITTSDVLYCWGAGLPARPAALGY